MRKKVYSVADLIKIEAEKAEARATALVSQDRCSKRQQEYLRCTFQLSVYDEVLSLIQQHDNGDLAADVLQVAKTKAKYTERKHQVSQKMVMLETLIELYPGNDPVSVGKRGGYKSSLSHAKQQLKECDEKLKSVGYGRQQ